MRSDRPESPPARARRPRALLAVGALLALAASAKGQSIDPGLPIPGARSVYVLDLPFLHFGPLDISAPRPGRVNLDFDVAYGNTFSHTWHAQAIHNEFGLNGLPFSRAEAEILHARHPQDFIAFADADVTRLALRATMGVTENLSVAVELPYVTFTGLRLDWAVESFHGVFDLYDEERKSFPKNQYLVVRQRPFGPLEYDDRTPTAGLSDIVATLRYRGEIADALNVSADLAVKAPTGDADQTRGSGSFDAGLLVGALYRFGEGRQFGLRAEAGLVLPGSFRGDTITTFDVTAFARLLVAADIRIGKSTFLAASVTWEQSPFRRDSVGDEAVTSVGFTMGLSRRLGDHFVASFAFLDQLPGMGDDTDFSVALAVKFVP